MVRDQCVSGGGFRTLVLGLLFLATTCAAQEQAAKPSALSGGIKQQLEELQKELESLRAAGKTKEADALEQQVQQGLSGLLLQFRQAQTIAMKQQDPATPRLEDVKQLIAKLAEATGPESADPLTKQLASLEQALKSSELPKTDAVEPEVHVLRITAGVALPDEFAKDRDHRTVGYAEVELKYSARPLTLVLVSGRPTLWNIKRNDSTLHAIVRQDANQEIIGAGDCAVLEGLMHPIRQCAGSDPATDQNFPAYGGEPLTIGPSNRTWLARYLLPRIDTIERQAKAKLITHQVAALKDVRFRAVHSYAGNYGGPSAQGHSVGEFTIAGPIINSLEPLPQGLKTAIVASGGEEPLRFALNTTGQLVMSTEEGAVFKPIPVSASLRTVGRFTSLCLDSKRNRIVVSPVDAEVLCAYDVAKGKWSRIGEAKLSIAAFVYQPENDRFLAVTRIMRDPRTGKTSSRLLTIDSVGIVAENHDLLLISGQNSQQPYVRTSPLGTTGVQLALVADKLVLLSGQPVNRIPNQLAKPPASLLRLLDPDSGKVLYEGPLRLHHDEDPVIAVNRPDPPPPTPKGLLPRVDQLFEKAVQVSAKLAERDVEQAEQFDARTETLRDLVRGGAYEREEEQRYTVSIWPQGEDRTVNVHLSDTAGPSILFLTSSRRQNEETAVKWRVILSEGVKLKEIVLGNSLDQLQDPPEGVKMRRHAANTPIPSSTSGTVMAYNLSTAAGATPRVTIGPESGQWRVEMATRQLRELINNSGIEIESRVTTELRQHRFFAVMRTGAVQRFAIRQQPGQEPKPSYWAEFSVHGPLRGTEKPITIKTTDQILGVTKDHVYVLENGRGISDFTLTAIDVTTDKREPLPKPAFTHSSHDLQATIDASRNRLYLISRHESTQVLDIATKQWKLFATQRFGSFGEMTAFHRQADMLYQSNNFGQNSMRRYNYRGALLDTIPQPMRARQRFNRQSVQTVPFGRFVGEVNYQNGRGTIQVIDLDNGDVVHNGALREHVARKDLPADELAAMYAKLTKVAEESDDAIWQMTAAHNAAVRFIDEQLPQPVVAQVDIKPLLRQLNSDDFAKRDAAFKKLQGFGSEIEPLVRRALKGKLPTETKVRLTRLMKTWESAAPQNGEERQHVNAVTVLKRIGSTPAKAMLRKIADGRGSPVAQRAAREALTSLGR